MVFSLSDVNVHGGEWVRAGREGLRARRAQHGCVAGCLVHEEGLDLVEVRKQHLCTRARAEEAVR